MSTVRLDATQLRVLGVLVEKERTVPDAYPLSLNALTAGCNQKNARDPVMNVGEAEVQQAVDALHRHSLLSQSSGARVARYEHNLGRALRIPAQAVALLATLMLRGPQTAAELRSNSDRLHRFADSASVEAFLDELAQRPAAEGGPLVARLPRQPGAREPRWMQLLGVEAPSASSAELAVPAAADDGIAQLRAEVAELRAAVEALRGELRRALPPAD